MKKITISPIRITREIKSSPHQDEDLHIRMIKSGCIDYENNFTIIDLNNGYTKIVAKNINKKIK